MPNQDHSLDVKQSQQDEPPDLEMPHKNELCTLQFRNYLHQNFTVFDFFLFGAELATHADDARLRTAQALAVGDRQKDLDRLEEVKTNPSPFQDKLRDFTEFHSQSMIIRIVDNFLSFLSEIIQEAIKRQPKILMSEEAIKVEDVLRFSRYSDLVSYLVEKKIHELSYYSFNDIERFVKKRTSLGMFDSQKEKTLLVLSIELRNIYSHNRGVVSEITLKRLDGLSHEWELKKGKRFYASLIKIIILSNNMVLIARRLDSAFAKKFGIKRKRYANYAKSV